MTRVKRPIRSRHLSRALGFASSLALLFVVNASQAQVDLYPPSPNIMLLVDTSGSMEYEVDGSDVTCSPLGGTNDKSRWTQVVEALTGTINNYTCETIDRLSSTFRDGVYRLNNEAPYDYNYTVPFHRALSSGCAAMPGNLPGTNAFVYPTGAVSFKHFASSASCTFSQQSDGLLDNYGGLVRFGLMTFDTSTDAGTGYSGTSPALSTGIAGTWSYVIGTSAMGAPVSCALTPQEVGARNAAAPAWEGRMVNFGNPSTGVTANLTKAQQIQDIIRATRPFGATPIAGMLKDAEDFFRNDETTDQDPEPTGASLKFAPGKGGDPYVKLGCRDQSILLLSDGQPNLDLRKECQSDPTCPADKPDCKCPFDKPESIALRLASATSEPVKTNVVAFALSSFTVGAATMTCSDDAILSSICLDETLQDNHPLQACCTLRRIAKDGGGQFFSAASPAELRTALDKIASGNIKASSRTPPVLGSSASGATSTQRFFSSFKPVKTGPWQGVLERQRFECVDDADNPGQKIPEPQEVRTDKGDKFADNLASDPTDRHFYTVRAGTGSDPIDPQTTIRPSIDNTVLDGVDIYKGTLVHGKPNLPSSDLFSADIIATSMGMPKTGCGTTNAANCGRYFMNWLVGNTNSGSTVSRCASSTNCNLLGDILHSTPKVVGRPVSLLRDETYSKFAFDNAGRPVVVYVSTNDGILHAFKTASNDLVTDSTDEARVLKQTNNELWAFIPPAVLPDLYKLYPQSHELLLDGAPVVKDVVASDDGEGNIRLQRSSADAQSASNSWRTILIQSFGAKRPGYFAVDVTEPVPNETQPLPDPSDADHSRGGPRFLWQLTEDANGNPLFGEGGVTPLITTLFFDPSGGDDPREVAVAVLPGGTGSVGTGGAGNTGCPAATPRVWTGLSITPTGFEPRTRVKCYAEHPGAHSLTVVRLDTGEIIRTFRRDDDEVPTLKALTPSRVIEAPLDSPITGQPVAYPAEVGAVADRVFVGDADGRLWKVDLSKPDPSDWKMDLFFDSFPNGEKLTNGPTSGQPIQTPPVISVDDVGNITVALSTGDQDSGGTVSNLTNYVWSLTEAISTNRQSFTTQVNWYKPLLDGERVTGAMALFSSELFFSTYKGPGTTEVCSSGTSNVYGMHYLLPREETEGDDGGAVTTAFGGAQFATAAELAGVSEDDQVQPIVFGVAVAQLPSCIADQTGAEDDWLGLGQHSTITNVNPGKFQLLMQAGTTGQEIEGATTKTITVDLQTPPSFSSVDSWTAILE